MDGQIIRLSVVNSTNIYTTGLLSQSDIGEWVTVVADSQTGGKGQRGRSWDSEYGKNLLCSTAIRPHFLKVHEQFMVSAAASCAIVNTLLDLGLKAQVKWPNDIIIGGKKVAGLLIENQLEQQHIEWSVVGLGLNVNQRSFNVYPWPATSLANELGKEVDLDELLSSFRSQFQSALALAQNARLSLIQAYNDLLLYRGEEVQFLEKGRVYRGKLKGVTLLGEIVLDTAAGEKKFVNGEVRLLHTSPV